MRAFGVLGRYVARQNIFLVSLVLGVGIGIYLLSDTFERLDDFLKAGVSAGTIVFYFGVKIPVIVSQILPAVYLLAMVIQLGVMSRSREMVALRAGGIPLGWFVKFFLIYGVIWSVLQLGFSQYIGYYGEYEANRIWKEDVRKKQLDELAIYNLWFRDGAYIVNAKEALPSASRARHVTVYEIAPEDNRLVRVISAEKALVDEGGWGLLDVSELNTETFETVKRTSQFLPVEQDLESFAAIKQREDRAQLPLWQLSKVIDELEVSGANVDRLKTAWHSKLSYAFSIAVMSLMAVALLTITENMYVNIGLSLLVVFVHYALHVVGVSAGQQGIVPPVLGAWFANIVFTTAATIRIYMVTSPGLSIRKRALVRGQ